MSLIRERITSERQAYVDEPIVVTLKPRPVGTIERSLAHAFGRRLPQVIRETIGHERVRLRWMKPAGKGLVPR